MVIQDISDGDITIRILLGQYNNDDVTGHVTRRWVTMPALLTLFLLSSGIDKDSIASPTTLLRPVLTPC
jgi:hypothetical protein